MNHVRRRREATRSNSLLLGGALFAFSALGNATENSSINGVDTRADCRALMLSDNLTLIYADLRRSADSTTEYCYVKGLIQGRITFHAQLPLPTSWNGRFVHLGDGGADGDLDYADTFVAQGYAVANSNTGHDLGAAGDAYGYQDDVAAADFAWRAVHLTTEAGKSLISNYYKKAHDFAYHFGCSTGGRQALVAAQLFPSDFDGIVAGAPAIHQLPRMAHRLLTARRLSENDYANNLAFDSDGDGIQESLGKVELLGRLVTERCDNKDGIIDGVIEPSLCDFNVERDLSAHRCAEDRNDATCFTKAQLTSLQQIYEGSRNSKGQIIYPGGPLGSEFDWGSVILPHAGNLGVPYFITSAAPVVAYTLYGKDPGLLPVNFGKPEDALDQDAALPQWGWWQVSADDVSRADLSPSAKALNGDDPDLDRFFKGAGGKLLLYQGLADSIIPPQPVIDYHEAVLKRVFANDRTRAQEHMRLFLAPGMGHCRGGPGPNTADWLSALTQWVEAKQPPERIIATHSTDGKIDNERPLCVYPQRAQYAGPVEGALERVNWKADHFVCR